MREQATMERPSPVWREHRLPFNLHPTSGMLRQGSGGFMKLHHLTIPTTLFAILCACISCRSQNATSTADVPTEQDKGVQVTPPSPAPATTPAATETRSMPMS